MEEEDKRQKQQQPKKELPQTGSSSGTESGPELGRAPSRHASPELHSGSSPTLLGRRHSDIDTDFECSSDCRRVLRRKGDCVPWSELHRPLQPLGGAGISPAHLPDGRLGEDSRLPLWAIDGTGGEPVFHIQRGGPVHARSCRPEHRRRVGDLPWYWPEKHLPRRLHEAEPRSSVPRSWRESNTSVSYSPSPMGEPVYTERTNVRENSPSKSSDTESPNPRGKEPVYFFSFGGEEKSGGDSIRSGSGLSNTSHTQRPGDRPVLAPFLFRGFSFRDGSWRSECDCTTRFIRWIAIAILCFTLFVYGSAIFIVIGPQQCCDSSSTEEQISHWYDAQQRWWGSPEGLQKQQLFKHIFALFAKWCIRTFFCQTMSIFFFDGGDSLVYDSCDFVQFLNNASVGV